MITDIVQVKAKLISYFYFFKSFVTKYDVLNIKYSNMSLHERKNFELYLNDMLFMIKVYYKYEEEKKIIKIERKSKTFELEENTVKIDDIESMEIKLLDEKIIINEKMLFGGKYEKND